MINNNKNNNSLHMVSEPGLKASLTASVVHFLINGSGDSTISVHTMQYKTTQQFYTVHMSSRTMLSGKIHMYAMISNVLFVRI